MKLVVITLLLIVMAACSSKRDFDCGYLREQITGQKITGEEAPKESVPKTQLPSPYKLGIYLYPPKFANRCGSSLDWLDEDQKRLLEIGTELKSKNIVSDIFIIKDPNLAGSDKKAIRAASTAGADAVLVIRGVGDINTYSNRLGYAYLLLVTALFVPGTEADGIFRIEAQMWDIHNEYQILSAEAEGRSKEIRPLAFIEEKEIIKKAKSEALIALKEQLYAQLINMGKK